MTKKIPLSPRKTPVQARSLATVEVILEATIQVLVSRGLVDLTCARVAERAGISVGSIYQYYPNKQALLVAALKRRLDYAVHAMETVCIEQRGNSLETIGRALTLEFIAVKMQRPDVSRALYALPSDETTQAVIASATTRGQISVSNLLTSCADARFEDPDLVASVFTGALIGPVQLMLSGTLPLERLDAVTEHLVQLGIGYLHQVSIPKSKD